MAWRRGCPRGRQDDAILTPTNFCYFDYSQSQNPSTEPLGIGGYVPVSKVYELEPTAHLTPEQAKHILGAQANLWTEYIPTLSHVQYMELPRLAAMSEVQWLQPEARDFVAFSERLPRLIDHYRALGYNYATHIFDIQGGLKPNPEKHVITANLRTIDNAPIYYTTDGSDPDASSTLYTGPVDINKTTTFKAVTIRPEGKSRMLVDRVSFNKATSSPITLAYPPHSRYASTGASVLTDGRFGPDSFNTGEWLGFEGNPLAATIDLGTPQEISQVSLNTLVNTPNWIFDARSIKVEVSLDGQNFTTVASKDIPGMTDHVIDIYNHKLTFNPAPARYVRVTAECEKSLPAWHGVGEGKPGFLFIDEIVVD